MFRFQNESENTQTTWAPRRVLGCCLNVWRCLIQHSIKLTHTCLQFNNQCSVTSPIVALYPVTLNHFHGSVIAHRKFHVSDIRGLVFMHSSLWLRIRTEAVVVKPDTTAYGNFTGFQTDMSSWLVWLKAPKMSATIKAKSDFVAK